MLAWLRRLHRWIGLAVAIPVAIQGLTGALLALESALPHLQTASGPPLAANRIVAAALADSGPDARLLRYSPPAEPGLPAVIQVVRPRQKPADIRIDPATLAVLPPDSGAWLWAPLRKLHVAFLVPEYGGRSIGGWFGIGLVLLLVTGVPIWWPRKGHWKAAVTIDRRHSGWSLQRSIHGAIGAWSVIALLVLAFTGVVLAFPATSRGLLGLETAGPPRPGSGRAVAAIADMDAVLDAASRAVPDGHVVMVTPGGRNEPARVAMAIGEGALGRVMLQIEPASLKIVSVQDARTAPPADRLYRWMHDLHEGLGLGLPWRLLVILAGIALPVFAVTGPLMWWLVRRGRRARRARMASAQPT
ncbi:MAG: PepSY domain-containing protein [Proteobacteria bacterium]|nr:PepSY domain-containing protein [Pseudomonadota bacterium]